MERHFVSTDGQDRVIEGHSRKTVRLQEAIEAAGAGDEIVLAPGVYNEPVVIDGKQTRHQPIVIRGDRGGGSTLDVGRNHVRPPGLPEFQHYAFFKIRNSAGVVIEDLTIQDSWPTSVYIEHSQGITLRRINFSRSTYAIVARGESTEGLLIEHCSWIQDDEIWQRILWKDIHQDPFPRKELDGDFFRSWNIKGRVVIRRNLIAQAFNGIHFFAQNKAGRENLNHDVRICENTFAFIRDNAIEAEYSATNWWVYQNRIYNCHKWFAFEKCNGGYWYIFANVGWFDRKPGPPGDEFNGGAVFKASKVKKGKEALYLPEHPVYVFHNSWYLRSAYLKKGKVGNFRHFNNAIDYCDPRDYPPGVGDPYREMLGSDFREEKWNRDPKNLRFENDVCSFRGYPELILARPGPSIEGIHADPLFTDPKTGRFEPKRDEKKKIVSPLFGASIAKEIKLRDGGVWDLPGEMNIGAVKEKHPDKPRDVLYTPEDLGVPENARPDTAPPGD